MGGAAPMQRGNLNLVRIVTLVVTVVFCAAFWAAVALWLRDLL